MSVTAALPGSVPPPTPHRPTRHRRLHVAIGAGLAATSLLLAGCGSGGETTSTTSSVAAPTTGCAAQPAAANATAIGLPSASVSLTGAGTEPRRVAAAVPDRTSPQQVTLTTSSTEESVSAATTRTVEMPLTARFDCSSDTELDLTLGTPTSPDPALRQQLAAAAGSTGAISLGPGLAPLSLRLAPTDASSSEARNAIEQSLVQALHDAITVPVDAIGVGATWRTERTIASAATVVQTVEARLTAWDGNRLTIAFTAEESPVNSVFTIPGGDATLTIARYSYTGSGEVTLDLTRGLPVGGQATYTGARELAGAGDQSLLQKLGFTLAWR